MDSWDHIGATLARNIFAYWKFFLANKNFKNSILKIFIKIVMWSEIKIDWELGMKVVTVNWPHFPGFQINILLTRSKTLLLCLFKLL